MKDEATLVKPQVLIFPEAKAQLDAYIRLCDIEVSGLGYCRQEGGMFIVENVLLLPQECSAGGTELDDDGFAEFWGQEIKSGRDPGNIRFWWHSHCNMGVFWSPTDVDNIDRHMNHQPWLISIVGNKRGEYRTRLDLKEPVRLSIDELPLNVYQIPSEELERRTAKELKKKVKEKVYQYNYKWPGYKWGAGGDW